MIRNYYKFLLAATLLFSLNGFSQTNMLKNPSFEDSFFVASENFDNWSINFNTIRTKVTDATDQSFAVKIQTNRSGSNGFFAELSAATPSNDLALENGKTYTISFDYKVETGTISELKATLLRDNFFLEDEEIKTNQTANGWQTFTYDFTSTITSAHNFDINLIGASANTEIIIDNTSVVEKIVNTDRDALIALYNATDGPNWTNTWDLNADMNTWNGIILNSEGRVLWIQMDSRNLAGELPDEIGNLSELELLRLGRNKLIGEIPTQIGNLLKLKTLELNSNELTGNIPNQLGNLSILEVLNISSNKLQGIIPNELEGLSSIKRIFLNINQLSGTIPVFLGNLNSLTHFEVFGNQLTGTIPQELGNLTDLQSLAVGNNNITGTIPQEIYSLTSLSILNAFGTKLTGSIPPEIGNLIQLRSLRLGGTEMSGTIPVEIGNLTLLEDFTLFRSNFSGVLPQEIGNLTALKTLDFGRNNFTGNIPSSIGNLTQLTELELNNNNFSGTLPNEIGNLILLENFFLSNNEIEGSLPSTIGNWSTIKSIWIDGNNFSGSIPPEIGNLNTLKTLNINDNELIGDFPAEMGDMTNLEFASFSFNNITGEIPKEIGNLPNLTAFECDSCSLSGNVPIFSSPTFNFMRLTNNNFVFDDLENFVINSPNLTLFISPQSNLNNEETFELELGDEINLNINGVSSSSNLYQWRKDGIDLINETNPTLFISSASVVNIGTYDCIITNPNVPSLTLYRNSITIGINGVDGESDDDGDGVKASNDYCPNTSPGVSVNINGCSENQLDDDNDGVDNTQDICPETASGENVNVHGCSSNQLSNNDADEDGVPDDLDVCLNTPPGAVVGSTGCSYQDILLPKPDDFTVKVTSTTCENKTNGELSVSFKVSQTHFINVSGPNNFSENYTRENGSSLNITELAPGNYKVVVNSQIGIIAGAPNTEFNLNLETPEDFKSGKIAVDKANRIGKIIVSGSRNYVLFVNEKEFNYSFDSTANRELSFELEDGFNNVIAKTDKECQGKYEENVLLNTIRTYPNPVINNSTIIGIQNVDEAEIIISNINGAIVKRTTKTISNSAIIVSMEDLPSGVYLVRIISEKQDVQTKIVKK